MKGAVLVGFLCICLAAFPGMVAAGEIKLFAAASLKEVLNELADGYARKNSSVKIVRNYGASGALAKQIENGAPADIFISANLEWMAYLRDKKLIDASLMGAFTYNTLVFAGSTERKIASMQDLLKLERIAIGSPKSVPAGDYAMYALQKAGIDQQMRKKLVMARDVRECLMYAERGEVDGAFVYKTDALLAKQAKPFFTVPQELYPRITYPMALTVSGSKNRDAAAFHLYLQSGDARAVLEKYGFAPK